MLGFSPSLATPDFQDHPWEKVRAQFSLTRNRVYFNNGTIGPSPRPVVEAVQASLKDLSARGEYGGQESSRAPVAEFVGAGEQEISLTHNTTEGINIVAAGLRLSRGDEVIVTSHEHAGNALPWLNQVQQRGIKLVVVDPADSPEENLERIDRRITQRTRVIAVPHITCTTGHVYPIADIARLAREKGILTCFDGAHGAGSVPLDLHSIDCDFYASCGHKWMLGPSGTGFLYVKSDALELLEPRYIGAYSDTGWDISTSDQRLEGYVPTAHRFDYGTQSAPLSHGLKASVDFLNKIGMDAVHRYTRQLAEQLYSGLQQLPVELLSPADQRSRSTMITFRSGQMDYKAIAKALGPAYRIRQVPESGLDAIRISTHIYNNPQQVNKFIIDLKKVLA